MSGTGVGWRVQMNKRSIKIIDVKLARQGHATSSTTTGLGAHVPESPLWLHPAVITEAAPAVVSVEGGGHG